MSVSEYYADRLQERLWFMTDRAGAWKKLAKLWRKNFTDSYSKLDDLIGKTEHMLQQGRDNPGLLLAGLVLEAHKEGHEIGNRASECLGWAFQNYLSNHPEAPNYLEVTLGSEPGKQIFVTVQRPTGKTPHQMRVETEGKLHFAEDAIKAHLTLRDELLAERDRLRAELEELKAGAPCR